MNTHQLKSRYDILNRDIEKAGPVFVNIRLLEKRVAAETERIAGAEAKIAAAAALDAGNPKLETAREKVSGYKAELAKLRVELDALYVKYQAPHFVYAWLDSMRRSIEDKDWPLSDAAVISIKLPGVLEVELTLDRALPF